MTVKLLLEFRMPLSQEMPDTLHNRWIILAQSGDKAAFGELVRMYHQRVVNVVYRMCGDVALAEDAAQAAFLNAWQRLVQFKYREADRMHASFRNWLYRIAINAAVDMLRQRKPQVDLDQVLLVDPSSSVEADVLRRERIQRVRQAVLALPQASRAVLVLREYEGLSYREIAEALDIPLGTVMSRLNYARSLLAQTLRPDLEDR
jgi:RNA polymerase sigma-70 factor, ECF subfamily